MSTSNVDRQLHLLSLDGGGVRGLSSIMILQHLMANISRQRGHVVQPWEEFDMIGGTSTGGLIAIMLGRLRMTLDECENAYLDLSNRIFNPKRAMFNPLRTKDFLLADGKFDHKVFEEAIKEILGQKFGFDDSTLLKDTDPQCKVFVCATRTGNGEAAIFRSYDTTEPRLLFDECKIWEACRATSAATTFFDPIKIGKYGQKFADGGILYNNPIQLVEREASAIWPDRMESAVMVSIGTGSAPGGTFEGNLMNIIYAMREITTQTERTSNDFLLAHQDMICQNRLYRFNVYHGLADVGLEESKEIEKIANTTQTYLGKGETRHSMSLCVEQLHKPGSPAVGPNSLDANNSRRIYSERDMLECIRSLSFKGITSRRNNISLAYQDTCDWLFETPSFRKWKDRTALQSNNGVFWIKGHPGVGKSTLMKHLLLHCQEEFKDHNIAFYFFNARGNLLERSLLGLLRSLIVQLLEHNPSLLEQFIPRFLNKKVRHVEAEREWETGELKEFLLLEFKRRQFKHTLLLIDALDECDHSNTQEVVDFFEDLSGNAIQSDSTLRICLSSRHYPSIDIEKKIELVIEQQAEHDQDIYKYVQSKLRVTNKDIQRQILEKAQKLFIWAVLVVELLNKEFNNGKIEAMRKKLHEVPSDLDELFQKLFEKEDFEDDKETTILIFQWVLLSIRPLRPAELYFAVLAGTDPEKVGAWDRSELDFETIKRFITNASRGLVEIVSDNEDEWCTDDEETNDDGRVEEQNTVRFIHQSVIDFLTRNQRLIKLDPTLAPKAIGTSHSRLAGCCICYIMQEELISPAAGMTSRANSNEGAPNKVEESYPLLVYALTNLFTHADTAQAEGISQIFLLNWLEKQGAYNTLQLLHDNLVKSYESYKGGQILYAMSLQGCYYLVRTLLLEGRTNVNAQGGYYGNPLQAAASRGHYEVMKLLLDNKAQVNAQGGYYGNALQAAAHSQGYYGHPFQAAGSRSYDDIVQLLLDHKAEVNAQGGYYGNALQAAAARGDHEILQLLLDSNADVNCQGGYFGNALQAAACAGDRVRMKGHRLVVQLLINNGADVNAQGGYYGNALQAAACRGCPEVVGPLLHNGAQITNCAIQLAALRGNSRILRHLFDRKARSSSYYPPSCKRKEHIRIV